MIKILDTYDEELQTISIHKAAGDEEENQNQEHMNIQQGEVVESKEGNDKNKENENIQEGDMVRVKLRDIVSGNETTVSIDERLSQLFDFISKNDKNILNILDEIKVPCGFDPLSILSNIDA